MNAVVMKFGGTSVQDAAALRRLVRAVQEESRHPLVIVSALAGVTDALGRIAGGELDATGIACIADTICSRHLDIVNELVDPSLSPAITRRLRARCDEIATTRDPDSLLALGELASSELVAAVLHSSGVAASWVDARDVIITDAHQGHARPDQTAIRSAAHRVLLPVLAGQRVPVMGGFVGATASGMTTTLGRGGSDYTAALVAAAVDAAEVQIWTDVDGVFSADPRKVAGPALIPELTFGEAYELARFGAKVLHWGTLEPAASHDIPVRVLNARRSEPQEGTVIRSNAARAAGVVGLAQQEGVSVADIRPRGVTGCLRFAIAAAGWLEHSGHGLTVIVCSSARVVVSGTPERVHRLVDALAELGSATMRAGAALVTIVGRDVISHPDAWAAVNQELARGRVNIVVPSQSGDALVCVTGGDAAGPVFVDLHNRLPLAVLSGDNRVVAQ